MKKKELIYTIIASCVLILLVSAVAYAYFGETINNENTVNLVITTPERLSSLTAYSTNPLSLNITADDLSEASTTAVKTDTGDIIVKLSAPANGQTVYCTYDIEFVWDTTDQYTTPSMTLNNDYKYEISLSGSQNIVGDLSGHQYTNVNFTERDLSSFSWTGTAGTIGRKATIVSGATIYSNSTTDTTSTWTFNLNFYSLPVHQSSVLGKNLSAHLTVANIIC